MALTIEGVDANTGSSITIPTHIAGDLIIVVTWRNGSTTAPSKPAAGGTVPTWNDILVSSGGGNSCAMRSAWAVASASTTTTGTWTNGSSCMVAVLRGQHATPIGGNGQQTGTNSTQATAPAITLSVADGTSVVFQFYGHRAVTAWDAAPSGYTRQDDSVVGEIAFNSKDVTTTAGAISQTGTMSSSLGYRGCQIEVVAAGSAVGNPWHTYRQMST